VQEVTQGGVTLKIYQVRRGQRIIFSVAHIKPFGIDAQAIYLASGKVPSSVWRWISIDDPQRLDTASHKGQKTYASLI
jgi:hypothetical protein